MSYYRTVELTHMKVDVTSNFGGLNGASLFMPTQRQPETLKFIDKTKLLLTEDDAVAALNLTRNHWFILQAITAFRFVFHVKIVFTLFLKG